jgi:hypothetical protein
VHRARLCRRTGVAGARPLSTRLKVVPGASAQVSVWAVALAGRRSSSEKLAAAWRSGA